MTKNSEATPSIKSFFQPEVRGLSPPKPSAPPGIAASDGFSESEVDKALHPSPPPWNPSQDYEEMTIACLRPGPAPRQVVGRIVNLYHLPTQRKKPLAAEGCLKLTVKDVTGVLYVRLWYARINYEARIGQLVAVYTTHLHKGDPDALTSSNNRLTTSVFPERDRSCHFETLLDQTLDEQLCRLPLSGENGKPSDGLVSLEHFIGGGHEAEEAKVLVCVKNVRSHKTVTSKAGVSVETKHLTVFDHSANATLALWDLAAVSATTWIPFKTILFLSHAGFRNDCGPTLSLNRNTYIDVNPAIVEAEWLKGHAHRLGKREHVNEPFPQGVFNVKKIASAQIRMLFTLADIDGFARDAPNETFSGYFSLVVVEMNLVSLHQREKLFSTQCCGVPTFSNSLSAKCKLCESDVSLRVNPRIVGRMVDETGAIQCGKLIWSDDAWWQLLGRSARELERSDVEVLRYMESRLLFLRLALMFGWNAKVGKLVILRVQIV